MFFIIFRDEVITQALKDLSMIQWIVECNPTCFGAEIFWFCGLKVCKNII